MKKIMLSVLATMLMASVFSQTAKDEMVLFDKTNVLGASISCDYDATLTSKALQNRFEQDMKLKGTNLKGFRYYQSQSFPEFGSLNYDIYTQVKVTGKKSEQKTVIYLLISKGNENFCTPTDDPALFEKMKTFLTNFMPYLREYDIDKKIQDQTKRIEKLEKENNALILARDKLKKQLEDKEKAIAAKADELAKIKTSLEELKISK
ncbi:MAG: hypothetical protein LBQ64_04030 [Bacteroidales bacterium]|jgi:regulator of replication initiation timing|nr:hypothetical protein [Bacteroidales bacterium]